MKKIKLSFLSILSICFVSTIISSNLQYEAKTNPTISSTLQYQTKTNSSIENGMEYVDVFDRKGNHKKFSRLIMGTDHLLQSEWKKDKQKAISDKEFNALLDEAAKLGINVFDSSPIYVGNVESNFGKWLKSRKQIIIKNSFYYNQKLNPDKKIYTISKGGFPFDLYNSKKLESGTHSKQLLDLLVKNNILDKNIIQSKNKAIKLKNVIPNGTYASRLYGSKEQITSRVSKELDGIYKDINLLTIFLMHRDDSDYFKFNQIEREQTPVKNILEALGDPKIANKYWMIGLSNWQTKRVNEAIALADKYKNLPKPILNSPYFSLFEMTSRTIHAGGVQVTHKDMMNKDFQKGIKIMPYSPLGGFSILDKPEPRWENAKKEAKKKYDNGDPYWQNVYNSIFTPENEKRYYRVVDFTKKFNKEHKTNYTEDQMINAYALAHTRMDFLTIGPTTIEQLRRTVDSLKLSHMLTPQNLEYLYNGK